MQAIWPVDEIARSATLVIWTLRMLSRDFTLSGVGLQASTLSLGSNLVNGIRSLP